MSFWTSLRNAVEDVAVVAGNYFLPGSSLVTTGLASKGSQQQLGSTLGQVATLAAGGAGAYGGNLANYGAGLSAMGVDTTAVGSQLPTGVSQTFGLSGSYGAPGDILAGGGSPEAATGGMFTDPTTGMSYPATGAGAGVAPTGGGGMLSNLMGGGAGAGAGGGGAGGIGWGSPLNLLQMGSGLMGLSQSQQQKQMAAAAQARAQQLGGALTMPTAQSVQGLPGYQSGLDAVQRAMASQGYAGSGNMMAALQQYGGNAYQQAMQNYQQQQGLATQASGLPGQLYQQGVNTAGGGLAALGQGATYASPLGNQALMSAMYRTGQAPATGALQ